MKKIKRLASLAAVSMVVTGGTASAATTFALDRNSISEVSSTEFSAQDQDGISLSITSQGGDIATNLRGVGVSGGSSSNRLGGGSERIDFSFDPSVNLLRSIVFDPGNISETITVYDRDGLVMTSFSASPDDGAGLFTHSFSGLSGSFFSFASTDNSTPNPGVLISSITVAAVPVPAALPLLVMGLGALGFAARRRCAADTNKTA